MSGPQAKDITSTEFEAAVIERSKQVPVVVDFWAPWCGPCRVLGPVIENEVAALGGQVDLVKINTDQDAELASAFSIQGIPAVKAFRDGKVVAEFVGAHPAPFVKTWLAGLLPSESARALAKARELLAAGRPDEVRAELARIDPKSPETDAIAAIERQLAFATDAQAYGGADKARAALAENPKDLNAHFALGSALAAAGDPAGALDHFLEVVSRNRKFKDDGARLAMLAIFDSLGGAHDLTQDYRRKLQIVL